MDMHGQPFRLPGETEEGAPLRAVDWAGLVARLGAERDLRRELSARIGAVAAGASFAASAVWALDSVKTGEAVVNPDASALRKATPANGPADPGTASAADSEA